MRMKFMKKVNVGILALVMLLSLMPMTTILAEEFPSEDQGISSIEQNPEQMESAEVILIENTEPDTVQTDIEEEEDHPAELPEAEKPEEGQKLTPAETPAEPDASQSAMDPASTEAEGNSVNALQLTQNAADPWSPIQSLIDNAAANDTIDLTGLRGTTANITLTISKNLTLRCDPSSEDYNLIVIKDLFFTISNNATLTLENIAIENTKLDQSVVKGAGNLIMSKTVIQPSTAWGTPTAYNLPATIDVAGDVTLMTDGDLFSCSVSGASIIERNSGQSGQAGTAIKAVNVTVNGGYVQGGSTFEANCHGGDGILASGNVSVQGVRQGDADSNALVQSGSIGSSASNTNVGVPIRFTDSPDQRVLLVQNADVFGCSRNSNGFAAPYTIVFSANDIALINNSKFGWYTDIPLFSNGFYSITNSLATWGTMENAEEVFTVTAVNANLTGTKTVVRDDIVTHYAAENNVVTLTANSPDGKQFKNWIVDFGAVTLNDTTQATTTFTMPSENVKVSAVFETTSHTHTHTASTYWSMDGTYHWHECTANDGERMDFGRHTYGSWVIDKNATTTEKGSKHRECLSCGLRETIEIPVITHSHKPVDSWSKDETRHWQNCTANDGYRLNSAAHTFGEWIIEVKATQTSKGSKYRVCEVCGQREEAEIPAELAITAGADFRYQIASGNDMTLTCSGDLDDLQGIYVDEKLVDPNDYSLKAGSTVLSLKASYLDTLSAGKHTLKFQYKEDLAATTEFTIVAKEASPSSDKEKIDASDKDTSASKSGNSLNLWIPLGLIVVIGGIAAAVFYKKRG